MVEGGGRWPADAQTRLMGMSTGEWSEYLSTELGLPMSADRVAALVIDRMAAAYADRVPVLQNADAVVRELAGRWPLGLASSSPRRLIDTVLDAMGWREHFQVTVSTEEVARGKPAPDVYLAAAKGLGAAPSDCVAIEDSTNGLRAAAAAGLMVIAIPDPSYPPANDALAAAALTVSNLGELTVEAVERLGNGQPQHEETP